MVGPANYSISAGQTTTANIAKSLTVSGITASNKSMMVIQLQPLIFFVTYSGLVSETFFAVIVVYSLIRILEQAKTVTISSIIVDLM